MSDASGPVGTQTRKGRKASENTRASSSEAFPSAGTTGPPSAGVRRDDAHTHFRVKAIHPRWLRVFGRRVAAEAAGPDGARLHPASTRPARDLRAGPVS